MAKELFQKLLNVSFFCWLTMTYTISRIKFVGPPHYPTFSMPKRWPTSSTPLGGSPGGLHLPQLLVPSPQKTIPLNYPVNFEGSGVLNSSSFSRKKYIIPGDPYLHSPPYHRVVTFWNPGKWITVILTEANPRRCFEDSPLWKTFC